MDAATDITIVLPTYNRRHVLERTIPYYQRLESPLLVVDDGSIDGTADWLDRIGVKVLRLPHRGLPNARNAGLRVAATPWVLFGEDDVLMPPGNPTRLRAWAGRLANCGAVCGLSYVRDDWEMIPGPPGATTLDGQRMLADFAVAPPAPRLLPSLHARSLIRRDFALAIGGFDESLPGSAFREESDFFARMWRAGHACWQVPDVWEVHVRHRLGGGCRGRSGAIAKLSSRWTYWRNNSRFVDRHHALWQHWTDVPRPGTIKARYAWDLLRTTVLAMRSRGR